MPRLAEATTVLALVLDDDVKVYGQSFSLCWCPASEVDNPLRARTICACDGGALGSDGNEVVTTQS